MKEYKLVRIVTLMKIALLLREEIMSVEALSFENIRRLIKVIFSNYISLIQMSIE